MGFLGYALWVTLKHLLRRKNVERESAYLTVNGQVGIAARSEHILRIKKSCSYVELIEPPARNYLEALRRKLKWGDR